ncbi:MAG: hypothetical protein A2W19_09265 [Spirochaetes bacterium RBG_16_49_21]|nr:MAG: hypothetical protein A2W19_09265 [Spirochaetes bacterium RBG_16_49_21]
MKKIIMASFVVVAAASLASGIGLNLKKRACETACETAKNECYEKAKDEKGEISDVKKAVCDTGYTECDDKCKKDYPDK